MKTRALWLGLLLAAAGLAQARPSANIIVPSYDLYYVGDMDPREEILTGVGDEILLDLTIDRPGTYHVSVQVLFGTEVLVTGELNATDVSAGVFGPWTLNQIRQNQLGGQFSGSGSFNEDFLNRVSGNSLPSGSYLVQAVIQYMEVIPPEEFPFFEPFIINDPRRVDLQSPWDAAQLFTAEPAFSWSGRASSYFIKVCEFDPERHGSAQEALDGDAMWEALLPGQTSVIYGELGSELGSARPLQAGHRYAWRVEAVLNTTSGRRQFASAIRTFTFSQGGEAPEQQLSNLLGGLTPSQLAGLAGMLENFRLNGTIMVDGRAVSLEEFQELLARIASGELNISSIRIE